MEAAMPARDVAAKTVGQAKAREGTRRRKCREECGLRAIMGDFEAALGGATSLQRDVEARSSLGVSTSFEPTIHE